MRYILTLVLAALPLAAQSTMPGHDMSTMPGMDMKDMPGMKMDGQKAMAASGTSTNPASTPMAMIHLDIHRWTLMFHGVAFVTDIQQTGPRAGDKLASINWFMAEAEHPLSGGIFAIRTMFSLEPATVTGREYPELFQTGETAFGKQIVDGQHPHNLVMEAALDYTHPLGANAAWEVYAAPVGDPALGPVAYPHRVSAAELPQAPLGHHLEDSTHISFDVVTAGLTYRIFHLEASGFHGAEPGENRWPIGYGAVDSWSGRLAVAPTANWSGQVSVGHLTHPEALELGDQNRISASATYNRPYTGGNWASSFIWGRVHKLIGKADLNGYTVESVARFRSLNYVTGRLEVVDKDELALPGQFRVGAYTVGYTRDLKFGSRIATGLGMNVTSYSMVAALHQIYGARPMAVVVFVRFKLRDAS
jgi:hypothetical protein